MKQRLISTLTIQYEELNRQVLAAKKISEKKQIQAMASEVFNQLTSILNSVSQDSVTVYFNFCLLTATKPEHPDYIEFCLRNSMTPISAHDFPAALAAVPI